MATIRVSADQPFKSRQGVDTVILLKSRYDPDLVTLLKDALLMSRCEAVELGRGPNTGGWLKKRGVWWVERHAWPLVRQVLLESGHTLDGEPPPEAEGSVGPRATDRRDTCPHARTCRFAKRYGDNSKQAYDRCLDCGSHLGWVWPPPRDLDDLVVDEVFGTGTPAPPPPPPPKPRQRFLFE
jgi:hypothetical protein